MSEETMTSDDTESGSNLTISEATTAFEGMLSTPEDSKEQPTEKEEDTQEAEVEETEVELEAEETEEVEEAEDDTEDDSENEEEVEEVKEEQTFTVKAAGEEKEVTLDELVTSYQLGSDYTKKTQEIAEQRKVIDQEAKAIIEARQVRDDYSQRLKAVEEFLVGSNSSQEDLTTMKENDPIGYAVKVAEMTEKKDQLQQVQAEQQRIAQQQQSDRSAQMQQYVEGEAQKLTQSLPEFSGTKGEQIRNEIRNYGKKAGFTDEELSQVYDHRYVLMLYKAEKYDKLMAGKAGVKKKVANAPKMIKGGAKVKQNVTDKQKKLQQRLIKSGDARDAASIFENLM
jgi:hypothetical protein